MKWDNLSVTNVLLLIIAVLMLIMVAQQPRGGQPYAQKHAPDLSTMGAAPLTGHAPAPGTNPHAGTPHGDASANQNFDFQNMIQAAMICPGDDTLTLADSPCQNEEAVERKSYIEKIYAQGLGPRALFDEIISTYGLEALTEEAREIRRTNRAQNP